MATDNFGEPSNSTNLDTPSHDISGQAKQQPSAPTSPLLRRDGQIHSASPSQTGSTVSRKVHEAQPTSPLKPRPNESLIAAARDGLQQEVINLLKSRTSFNIIALGSETNGVEVVDDDGVTEALHAAILAKQTDTAEILIASKGIKFQNTFPPYNRTILHEAVAKGLEKIVSKMVHSPLSMAYVDLKDTKGRTVLHDAVAMGYGQIVSRLLRHPELGRFINLRDYRGRTALHDSATRGDRSIVKELLSNGADLEALNNDSVTPLYEAVISQGQTKHDTDDKTVQFLIENGAKVNTRDSSGNSPLHEASRSAREPMMRLLLRNGADPDCLNNERKTPQDVLPVDRVGKAARRIFFEPREKWKPKIISEISPYPPTCSESERTVCDDFFVTVRFYWRPQALSWSQTASVHNVVYNEGTINGFENEFIKIIEGTLSNAATTDGRRPAVEREDIWKWIHFPANNMTWVKDLVLLLTHDEHNRAPQLEALRFIERNIRDWKGYNNRSITRVPHAEDSWKEDARNQDIRKTSLMNSLQSQSMTGEEKKHHYHSPAIPEMANTHEVTFSPGASSKGKGTQLTNTDNKVADTSALPYGRLVTQEIEIWRHRRAFPKGRKLSLVIPYFDFETELYLVRFGEKMNTSSQFKRMTRLEECYSPFRGTSGLQSPQTLDQSYYDMLTSEDLMVRDRDQVVYKWFNPSRPIHVSRLDALSNPLSSAEEAYKIDPTMPRAMTGDEVFSTAGLHESPESSVKDLQTPNNAASSQTLSNKAALTQQWDGYSLDSHSLDQQLADAPRTPQLKKLLMIHQLWLWKMEDGTIITSFPERWHTGVEDTLLETIRQSGINDFRHPEDLVEHIVYQAVSFLEEYRYAGLGNHILDIFESSIATRSNQEVMFFKKFNAAIQNAREDNSAQKSKNDAEPSEQEKDDIDGEINLIYEVKDIRDELHLILRVFKNQAAVIDKFSKLFWPVTAENAENETYRRRFVEDCGVQELIERTEKLDEDAGRTLEGLDYLVQVKQAQSSLKESVAAGEMNIKAFEEAKRSQKLNNYIMLFTTIAVIFTPLSFMTSLFAIPIDQFPQDDQGNLQFTWEWFLGRMFAGELISLGATGVGNTSYGYPRKSAVGNSGSYTMRLRL